MVGNSSVEALVWEITRVRQYLDQFEKLGGGADGVVDDQAPVNNSELSTRYIVIDPVLRALGWDLGDPAQVILEHRLKRKRNYDLRPDYLFRSRFGGFVGVLEAKRIFVDTRSDEIEAQVARYIQHLPSLQFSVRSNGQWWTIDHIKNGGFQAESEGRGALGLQAGSAGDVAVRLWQVLASSRYGW